MSTVQTDALKLIEQWLSQVPKDEVQIREAESDLREFQQALNLTREQAGARAFFPQ